MKSIFSSRRNKNPHNNGEAEKKETPFFSKENKSSFFQAGGKQAVQTKLTVGQPGDKYEKEADNMADAVVNNTSKPAIQNKEISSIQRESLATPQEDEKLGTAEQRMEEDKLVQEKPEIQRMEKPEEEEGMVNKMEGREEEEGMLNKMEGREEEEEKGALQTKSNTTNKTASTGLSKQIKNKSGKGKSLSKSAQAEMESSFGTDFSDVNIHTDQDSVKMNKELGAQAFTHGKDVYFNSGKYDPDSTQGKKLLAHELTHVVQQNKGKQIQKEAETDASGNYTNNYIFRPNPFFRRVKSAVTDGSLSDDEIRALKAYAIRRNGTVQHSELLLLAAMRNTANIALMNAHSRGNLIISMTAIPAADRDYVTNIDREGLPLDIQVLRLRRLMAQYGLSTENVTNLNNEIEIRTHEEIEAAGGTTFRPQAERLSVHLLSGSTVPPENVLTAMLNAASDGTHGDKVMAGIAYVVAADYNHPMANRLLNGTLKVDALIRRVYRRLLGEGDASYSYSTDVDLTKADTLYLPTDLDIFDISSRALIIHELTHAEDDFSATTTRDANSIDLEVNAYRAQSRYIMDQIRSEAPGSVPGLVTTGSELADSDPTHYWAYISATKRDISTYRTVLNEILTAAPTSKSAGDISTDLGNSLAVIDANLRSSILGITDARGRNLYNATSQTRLDGASGHFFN